MVNTDGSWADPYPQATVASTSQAAPVSISAFFPCYNERANIGRTVGQALKVLESLDADFEVIIVDDGSVDETGEIADQIASGDSWDDIILGYPELEKEDIQAALLYASASLDHTEVRETHA